MLDKSNESKYIVSRIDSMKDKFKAIEKELGKGWMDSIGIT